MSSELTFFHDSRYGLIPPEGAVSAFQRVIPAPEVYSEIYRWALQQSRETEAAVMQFLANPTDEELEVLVKLLAAHGLIIAASLPPLPKERSIRTRILEYLHHGPQTIYDLFDLAQEGSINPEAAVRQAVRVLARKGKVTVDGITVRITNERPQEIDHVDP